MFWKLEISEYTRLYVLILILISYFFQIKPHATDSNACFQMYISHLRIW